MSGELTSAVSSRAGLTSAEAERRLAQYGPNDPAPKKQRPCLVELLLQFANPLVAILLLASIVSAFVGELVNAAITIVIVSLSMAVNFVQTFRSQQAADRLRATVAPTATVLRDGVFSEVHRADVVPGDVVRLGAGDLVPADARLLEAKASRPRSMSLMTRRTSSFSSRAFTFFIAASSRAGGRLET